MPNYELVVDSFDSLNESTPPLSFSSLHIARLVSFFDHIINARSTQDIVASEQ
jgi:hypothetical protein